MTQKISEALEPLVAGSDVAEFLGIPEATLRQWQWRKIGPRSYKIGRHRKYRLSEVAAWTEMQSDRPPAA